MARDNVWMESAFLRKFKRDAEENGSKTENASLIRIKWGNVSEKKFSKRVKKQKRYRLMILAALKKISKTKRMKIRASGGR